MPDSQTTPELITTGLYRTLAEFGLQGKKPQAIYLGHALLRQLDEACYRESGYYGERARKFASVPLFEVVGDAQHFNVTISRSEP